MIPSIWRKAAVAAALCSGMACAHAATVTLTFDYMATNLAGDFATASGGTAVPVGTLTLTDLSDLGLGDGRTGVRASMSITGLSQFSSGAGSVFLSSYELNFPGTDTAGPGGVELSSVVEGVNWRYVSGLNVNTARANGPIEFAEGGATNGWSAFQQEINYVSPTTANPTPPILTDGVTSTIDFLNGFNGYNGFSVAQLLANPVQNANASLPDAYGWIRIRSFNQGITTADNGLWWQPAVLNANGGRLDVLAVAAVPEPETYALMAVGLLVVGGVARKRYRTLG